MRIEATDTECKALLSLLNESHAAIEQLLVARTAVSLQVLQHLKVFMPLLGQLDKKGIVLSRFQYLITIS